MKKNRKEEPQESSPQADNPLDTIFVSSEVAPWSKTGGLGDVVGSLPIALASRGHRVMVVAPRWTSAALLSPHVVQHSRSCFNLAPNNCLCLEDAVDILLATCPCMHRPPNHDCIVRWTFAHRVGSTKASPSLCTAACISKFEACVYGAPIPGNMQQQQRSLLHS